jgi:hypothetical protein
MAEEKVSSLPLGLPRNIRKLGVLAEETASSSPLGLSLNGRKLDFFFSAPKPG